MYRQTCYALTPEVDTRKHSREREQELYLFFVTHQLVTMNRRAALINVYISCPRPLACHNMNGTYDASFENVNVRIHVTMTEQNESTRTLASE